MSIDFLHQKNNSKASKSSEASDALFDIDVSSIIGEEYIPLVQDVSRMITLQIIIQFMLFLRDSDHYPFFSESFFELLFYIILGLMFYWLVIRKSIRIV